MKAINKTSLIVCLFLSPSIMMANNKVNPSSDGKDIKIQQLSANQSITPESPHRTFATVGMKMAIPSIRLNGLEFSKNGGSFSTNILFQVKGVFSAGLEVGYLTFYQPYLGEQYLLDRNYHAWNIGPTFRIERPLWQNASGTMGFSADIQFGIGYSRFSMSTNASDKEKREANGNLNQKALNGFSLDAICQIKYNVGNFYIGLGYMGQAMSYKGNFAGIPLTKRSRSVLDTYGAVASFGFKI